MAAVGLAARRSNHTGGAFAAGGGRIFDAAKCVGDAVGEHLFAALRCRTAPFFYRAAGGRSDDLHFCLGAGAGAKMAAAPRLAGGIGLDFAAVGSGILADCAVAVVSFGKMIGYAPEAA